MLPARALSLRQPWLHFILSPGVLHPKRLENRTRRILNWTEWTPRVEFWLHAAKGDDPGYWSEARRFVRARFGEEDPPAFPPFQSVTRGGIVGRCRIVGMVTPAGEFQPDRGEHPAPDMRWHIPGQHAYVLADVVPVPLVPCRGLQGFFPVPPEVLRELEKHAA